MGFRDQMRRMFPNYGDQQHQRDFIERMDRMQHLAPCDKEHDHEPSCYPQPIRDAVAREQMSNRAANPVGR
jgi:hypothetical protein